MTETPQPPEPQKPAAGWYPDASGVQRYWDGNAWTGHTQGATVAATPTVAQNGGGKDRPWFKKKRIVIPLGIVAVFVIAGIAGGNAENGSDNTAEESKSTEQPVSEAKAEEPKKEAKTEKPKAKPKPAKPNLSVAQENAVGAAESYLAYTAFSRKGLIEQLEFDDYSTKDATFAVDRVKPDWNEQAAKAAKNYLDYTSFSRGGLIEQLKFDGYTTEQATYGVDKTGL